MIEGGSGEQAPSGCYIGVAFLLLRFFGSSIDHPLILQRFGSSDNTPQILYWEDLGRILGGSREDLRRILSQDQITGLQQYVSESVTAK